MDLKQEKILGGIGAILTLFFIIPVIGWIISIVGLILIAISVKGLSDKLNEKLIFTNYLTSIIFFFLSVFTLIGTCFLTMFKIIKNLPEKFNSDFFNFGYRFDFFTHRRLFRDYPEMGPKLKEFLSSLDGKLWILLLIIAIVWILLILGGIFKKVSFDKLSEKIRIDEFKISGFFVFLGAILVPLFGVGIILMLIGVIFEIISFFSIKDKFEPSKSS
ncbi:MAG: DUF996 domain-containing protein [Caldisericia bacterium]|jgi:uncharacterized membrane protein|nr:DUF996 domain-containing protein [Caldisericia bacterium]